MVRPKSQIRPRLSNGKDAGLPCKSLENEFANTVEFVGSTVVWVDLLLIHPRTYGYVRVGSGLLMFSLGHCASQPSSTGSCRSPPFDIVVV